MKANAPKRKIFNDTILLYYPIEDVMANYTNTFNVYMKVLGGTGSVDVGSCIASISGQSMGANAAWDGTITVDEYIAIPSFGKGGGGVLKVRAFTHNDSWEIDETLKREYSESIREKAMADKNPGFEVYDWNGKQIYPEVAEGAAGGMTNADCPFMVKVSITDLNIRKGAGTNTAKTGKYTGVGSFTIVEVKDGKGSKKGWGRLKSGAGWISLDYCEKI